MCVVRGTNVEAHVQKRCQRKTGPQMRSSLRPQNIESLLNGMPLSFQRRAADQKSKIGQNGRQKEQQRMHHGVVPKLPLARPNHSTI